MADIDIRGRVVQDDGDFVIFENDTGKQAKLPREEIAIIQEIEGVTVSLPWGLARAKGLL